MNWKFLRFAGPFALLGVLVVADQIRLGRPAHKYRLSLSIETPEGVRSASGVMAVHPNRGYGGSNTGESSGPRTKGDAIFVDLGGGRNAVMLMTHGDDEVGLDSMSYLALRAYTAAGQKVQFRTMNRAAGTFPVKGNLIPVLVTFSDVNDPGTAHLVRPDDFEAVFGKGVQLHDVSVEVVANGLWPIDFGGVLGEPVTRGIETRLPWLKRPDHQAATALRAAGLGQTDINNADAAFERK
jgi:hypothetical protein